MERNIFLDAIRLLNIEISYSFKANQQCTFYIFVQESPKESALLANSTLLYTGEAQTCRKIYEKIVEYLKDRNLKIDINTSNSVQILGYL